MMLEAVALMSGRLKWRGLRRVAVTAVLIPGLSGICGTQTVTAVSAATSADSIRGLPDTTKCKGPGDFGVTYLSSSWPGGFAGVPIYSDGGEFVSNCYNNVMTPSGKSVRSGMEWQCVELVNRLYITRGWISSTWSGNGNQLYNTAPSVGLTNEQRQGTISYLAPGDVISFNGPVDGGHAAVVSKVAGSAITLVNQNTRSSSTISTATLSNGTLTMHGWAGYHPIGVIHAPGTSASGHLRQFYVSKGKWTAFDVSKATGVSIAGDPFDGASGIFARDTSGHLRQFYVSKGKWTAFDVSKATGVSIAGDPYDGASGIFADG
jgi:hypothetical protein